MKPMLVMVSMKPMLVMVSMKQMLVMVSMKPMLVMVSMKPMLVMVSTKSPYKTDIKSSSIVVHTYVQKDERLPSIVREI